MFFLRKATPQITLLVGATRRQQRSPRWCCFTFTSGSPLAKLLRFLRLAASKTSAICSTAAGCCAVPWPHHGVNAAARSGAASMGRWFARARTPVRQPANTLCHAACFLFAHARPFAPTLVLYPRHLQSCEWAIGRDNLFAGTHFAVAESEIRIRTRIPTRLWVPMWLRFRRDACHALGGRNIHFRRVAPLPADVRCTQILERNMIGAPCEIPSPFLAP